MIHAGRFAAVLLSAVFAGVAGCGGGKGGGADGGGGAGGAVNCHPRLDAGSCACSGAGPSSLSECSGDSVASTDHGYCCRAGGNCTCYRIACVNVLSIGHCECGGPPYDDTSPRVDVCSAQPAGAACCLDPSLHPSSCWCNVGEIGCPPGHVAVPSCSLADVMNCAASETMVDRCK